MSLLTIVPSFTSLPNIVLSSRQCHCVISCHCLPLCHLWHHCAIFHVIIGQSLSFILLSVILSSFSSLRDMWLCNVLCHCSVSVTIMKRQHNTRSLHIPSQHVSNTLLSLHHFKSRILTSELWRTNNDKIFSRVVQITLPPSISSTRVSATNPTHPDQVTSSSVTLPQQIPTTALVTHTQHHQAFPLTTAITTATTTTNTPQMRLPTPTPTIQLSQLQTHDSLSLAAHMSQTLPSLGSITTTTLGPPATTAGVQVTNCNVSLAAAVAGVTANINQLLPSKYRSTGNNCFCISGVSWNNFWSI